MIRGHYSSREDTEDLHEVFVCVKRDAAFSGTYGCWPSSRLKTNFHVSKFTGSPSSGQLTKRSLTSVRN